MDLSQEEKDRIIAEEKLRMETRKEFLNERMYGGCCGHRGGWRFFRVLAIILGLFALLHIWHRPFCGWGHGYQGCATNSASQAAPAAPTKAQ